MLDYRSVGDILSDYVPYIQNTYFVVFAISSLVYLASKLLTSRFRRSVFRPPAIQDPVREAIAAPAPPRVPLLRGAVTFIM
jgi:hypothetical protein